MAELVKLGKSIELSGFNDLDPGSMLILRKMIGNRVRKISDISDNFENIRLVMKAVHSTDGGEKFEVKGLLNDNGQQHNADHVERNIFITVDKVLDRLENSIKK